MLLALFGAGIASAFALLSDVVAALLPADAWTAALAYGDPLAFLVPPTFAASVPLVLAAMMALGGARLVLNLVGRR